MDFKKILNTLDGMEARVITPAAPTLPKSAQLNEDAQMRVLAGQTTVLAEAELMEKAKSKAQQKAAGAALAAKRGEGTAKGASKEMTKMDTKELKKVAGTKHKGLPEKKTESIDEAKDDDKYVPPKKTEKETTLPSGAKVKTTVVKGGRSQKAEKDSELNWAKESVELDVEEFNETFSAMVEAAKEESDADAKKKREEKKKKIAKIVDEGAKPDFLDLDKDGDKKEPMKKAAADKKAGPKKGVNPFAKKDESVAEGKSPAQKAAQEKFKAMVGKKKGDAKEEKTDESKMIPQGKKKPVKESKLQPTPELMKKVRARLEQLHDEMEPEEAYEQMADELNITTRRLEQLLQDKRFFEADMGEAWSHNDAMQTNHNNKVSVMAAKEQADKATDPKAKEFWTRRYQMLAKRYNISVKEGRMRKSVKESVERKLSFKEMMNLVVESGGQQQIDPTDQALFAWAQRVAETKLGEGMKAEVYAGLVYERMGGRFEMYDVLSENKK